MEAMNVLQVCSDEDPLALKPTVPGQLMAHHYIDLKVNSTSYLRQHCLANTITYPVVLKV